ncbi:MAG: ABC transporter, partial [Deltaproteobacteria bacterium]
FKQRDAIVVYTSTEPAEALKLGGNIVILDEGRVLQTGITSEVFHRPATIKVAEVFSDPPINLIDCNVEGPGFHLGNDLTIPLTMHMKSLTSGDYIVGIRSNHLHLNPQNKTDIAIEAILDLAEINGSETFFHVNYTGTKLVVQELGVYSKKIGSKILFYLDPANLFVFSKAGELILSPKNASA